MPKWEWFLKLITMASLIKSTRAVINTNNSIVMVHFCLSVGTQYCHSVSHHQVMSQRNLCVALTKMSQTFCTEASLSFIDIHTIDIADFSHIIVVILYKDGKLKKSIKHTLRTAILILIYKMLKKCQSHQFTKGNTKWAKESRQYIWVNINTKSYPITWLYIKINAFKLQYWITVWPSFVISMISNSFGSMPLKCMYSDKQKSMH